MAQWHAERRERERARALAMGAARARTQLWFRTREGLQLGDHSSEGSTKSDTPNRTPRGARDVEERHQIVGARRSVMSEESAVLERPGDQRLSLSSGTQEAHANTRRADTASALADGAEDAHDGSGRDREEAQAPAPRYDRGVGAIILAMPDAKERDCVRVQGDAGPVRPVAAPAGLGAAAAAHARGRGPGDGAVTGGRGDGAVAGGGGARPR